MHMNVTLDEATKWWYNVTKKLKRNSMHNTRFIAKDTFWVGADDRRLNLFENIFPIPEGISYNAYVVKDKKTVLLDTVDDSVRTQFLENIDYVLEGRDIDYLFINHMEPDHCAVLEELAALYPEMKLVASAMGFLMIRQFFDTDISDRAIAVKDGDTLCTGTHTFTFTLAPMVHWPEVMVTYDTHTKALFSADAFGTFGALNGNIFSDEINFEKDMLDGARRYYANIVGKYGVQVQALLKKAALLDIALICPLHGPVWRNDLDYFIKKYDLWSRYEPEDKAVVIAYASMYGHTASAVDALAGKLSERGVRNICVYDVSKTHMSYVISEIFRASTLVIASPTYNMGIYPPMEALIHDMKALNVQNRTIALIENGTWAPAAAKNIKSILDTLSAVTYMEPVVTIKSSVKKEQEALLDTLAENISNCVK
jgi:flavorubredoxin